MPDFVDGSLPSAWLTQPVLNPWLVVLIGGISGLLVFALSSAIRVLVARHHAARLAVSAHPFMVRLRDASLIAGLAAGVLLSLQLVTGRKLVDGQGWLVGDGLFAVTRQPGFVPSYPNTNSVVEKDEAILQLRRDAGPEEIAAAKSRRALLQQEVEFIKLSVVDVDSLVLRDYLLAKSHLQDLENRQQHLLDARDVLDRGAPRQQLEDEGQLHQVNKNLQDAQFEFDQNETSLETAVKSLEFGRKAFAEGLIAEEELDKRRERAGVLSSRRAELRARLSLLAREQERLRALARRSESAIGTQRTQRRGELNSLNQSIAMARTTLEDASESVEEDKKRAHQQQQARIRQIQIQIDDIARFINAPDTPISVHAPWQGIVGFREPSPASVRSESRPLLVLYEPGKVSVRLQISRDQANVAPGERLAFALRALTPEAANSPFAGELARAVAVDEQLMELHIICDPPAPALRELALGSAVPVSVIIRRPGVLSAAGVTWPWGMAVAGLVGIAGSELRARRRARQGARNDDMNQTRREHAWINWGGDPDEVLEYVVGVGIVSKPLRQRDADHQPPVEERLQC